jgi:hypothetical protein
MSDEILVVKGNELFSVWPYSVQREDIRGSLGQVITGKIPWKENDG